MTPQNPLTPNSHKSDNEVLDEIINQKYSYSDDYGATSGESIFQRYIANLAAREPITIALTIIPVVFLLFTGLALSGGQKSHTVDDPDNVSNSSEVLEQTATEPNSLANFAQSGNNTTRTGTNAPTSTAVSEETRTTSSGNTSQNSASNNSSRNNTTTVINPPTETESSPTPAPAPKPTTPIITPVPLDLCSNMSGTQTTVPTGYVRDSSGKCTIKVAITPPVVAPPIKLGTLCRIADRSLNESSGLAASIRHSGIVYTHNDEVGPILAVRISDCKVVARLTVTGLRGDPDPEAITIDRTTGKIWFGDIGNGHPNQPKSMTDKKSELKYPSLPARIVTFAEPSQLSGNIRVNAVSKYDITYQGGMQNSESLLVNPKTGQGYLINKQATSTIYALPKPIKSGTARNTGVRIPGWVTDATFTTNGKWILIRYRTATDPAPTKVLVYNATTWKQVGTIAVPKVGQGESITMEKSGNTFLIGSEGSNSPLVRVALPNQYK